MDMNPYLARLRALNFEKGIPHSPSKPSKSGFEGFEGEQGICFSKNQSLAIVQKSPAVSPFEHFEQIEQRRGPVPAAQDDTWTDAEEERAAIAEYDGGAPRAWAEALARLDPNKPPSDVPPQRWLRFVDDCGRFLDGGWAARAVSLGWGPLDLFGCDRERPFARVDHLGLLWLVKGGTIVELHRDRAILETERGVRQCYRRRPVEVGRVVLAWEGRL
jgi:hypothetical protein